MTGVGGFSWPSELTRRNARLLERQWRLTPHAALHAAELLRVVPGLHITSGRRSRLRNRLVGGVTGSFHLEGRGVDFGGSRACIVAGAEAANKIRVSPGCTGPEEVIIEEDHLHTAF